MGRGKEAKRDEDQVRSGDRVDMVGTSFNHRIAELGGVKEDPTSKVLLATNVGSVMELTSISSIVGSLMLTVKLSRT